MTSKNYRKKSGRKPRHTARHRTRNMKNSTVKKTAGGWWPFQSSSGTPSQAIDNKYNPTIEKYTKQIARLQAAIKVIQNKISNIEIAKAADLKIAEERKKISDQEQIRAKAVKEGSTSSWWPFK